MKARKKDVQRNVEKAVRSVLNEKKGIEDC